MSREFRVLMTDRAWPDCSIERDILSGVGAQLVEAPDGDESTLVKLAREVDAIGTNWAQVTEKVIRAVPALPNCRAVRHRPRQYLHQDGNRTRDSRSRNVPDYCVSEVSDHALALILACAEYCLLSRCGPRRANTISRPARR